MEKKQNKAPLVRFPEFKEDWESKELVELVDRVTTKNKENNPNVLTISAQHGLISQLEFFNKSVSAKNITGYYLLNKNDFAYNKSYSNGYPMGAIKRLKRYDKGVVSTLYICFRNRAELDNSFAEHFYETGKQNKEIKKVAQEGARNHGLLNIGLDDFFSIKLSLPTIPEQQKIAHFFTTLDKKIDQLQEKKNALEEYKKVMMQKLFSQELRFKDEKGKDYPDWDEKKLGEVSANIMYGMNASSTTFDGKNKYLRITDIDENTRTYIPNPITSPQGIIEDKYKLSEGDIVFTRTGASVGKSYLYDKKEGDLFFAGFLIRFAIKKGNPNFIYYQTLTEKYNKWVITMSMRSGQPGLNANEYKEFEIVFPSIHEQNKIANFLSKIDEKINTVNEQIKQTKTYKKGLLQKMFV